MRTPASKNPTMGTSPIRWHTYATTAAARMMATTSTRNGGTAPAARTNGMRRRLEDHPAQTTET